jgi:hypothetical protein
VATPASPAPISQFAQRCVCPAGYYGPECNFLADTPCPLPRSGAWWQLGSRFAASDEATCNLTARARRVTAACGFSIPSPFAPSFSLGRAEQAVCAQAVGSYMACRFAARFVNASGGATSSFPTSSLSSSVATSDMCNANTISSPIFAAAVAMRNNLKATVCPSLIAAANAANGSVAGRWGPLGPSAPAPQSCQTLATTMVRGTCAQPHRVLVRDCNRAPRIAGPGVRLAA